VTEVCRRGRTGYESTESSAKMTSSTGAHNLKSGALAVLLCLIAFSSAPSQSQSDWPMYGHDYASTRYSPLNQINTQNVQRLVPAWTYHMNKTGMRSTSAGRVGRGGGRRSSQATPIVVNDVLYMPTPYNSVVALEPETGKEIWSYKLVHSRPAGRGVAYWPGDKRNPASIIFGTSDARLISLNAKTGKPTPGFVLNGAEDIKKGVLNGFPDAQ